jgi:twitching motility protein PilT
MKTTARIKELIEDKDRTKEIADAIAQGNVAYGMQTFDQSLMQLVRQGLITYQEALRQASNPDDFALRYQGVSSTADSKWDGFDQKQGEDRAVPGSMAYVQQMNAKAPAAPAPGAAPTGASRANLQPVGGAPVTTPAAPQQAVRPAAPAPAPAPAAPKPATDDDFQIERF